MCIYKWLNVSKHFFMFSHSLHNLTETTNIWCSDRWLTLNLLYFMSNHTIRHLSNRVWCNVIIKIVAMQKMIKITCWHLTGLKPCGCVYVCNTSGSVRVLEYTCLPSILDSVPGLLSPALAPRIDFAVRIFTIYVLPEGKGSKRKIKWQGDQGVGKW